MGGDLSWNLDLKPDAPTFQQYKEAVNSDSADYDWNWELDEKHNFIEFSGQWYGSRGTGVISDYILWLNKGKYVRRGYLDIDPYYSPVDMVEEFIFNGDGKVDMKKYGEERDQ